MSIIIKGMEMPKTCSQCPLCYDYMMCSLRDGRFSHMGESFDCCEMRLADCPLVELPTHGDLIDRDYIQRTLQPYSKEDEQVEVTLGTAKRLIQNAINAPVIVPAERSDTDA